MKKEKIYNQAPLPFIGQKRMFVKPFIQILKENIANEGEGLTFVDAFGGSGLLAHNVKRHFPAARVIYNDYDNYSNRIAHIDDTNRLRAKLFDIVKDFKCQEKLPKDIAQKIDETLDSFDGFIDEYVVVSWLFYTSFDKQLKKSTYYNNIIKNDYCATGYLDGLEIVQKDALELMSAFQGENTVWILDPPYMFTDTSKYKSFSNGSFNLKKLLEILTLCTSSFILFSSEKTEIESCVEFVQAQNPFLIGYEKYARRSYMSKHRSYLDNMIYRFRQPENAKNHIRRHRSDA